MSEPRYCFEVWRDVFAIIGLATTIAYFTVCLVGLSGGFDE